MIFDTSISGMGYAPYDDEEKDVDDNYENESADMDSYYEEKFG